MAAPPPERLVWLVELLDVRPGQRLLELGCGRGVAVDLCCARVGDGHVVGLDRSQTAIDAAEARNARWVEAGTASFELREIERLPDRGPFDTVFAMNVNLFWTGDPVAELRTIRDALTDHGRLVLGWETPAPERAAEIVDLICAAFRRVGLVPEVVRHPALPGLVAVAARAVGADP